LREFVENSFRSSVVRLARVVLLLEMAGQRATTLRAMFIPPCLPCHLVEPHAIAVAADYELVAVMFNNVDPLRAGRHSLHNSLKLYRGAAQLRRVTRRRT